jgi:hypothetical protein
VGHVEESSLPPEQEGSTYCSKLCKQKSQTASHARYVSANRAHIRQYAKDRKARFWGISDYQTGLKAESFAMEKVLPKLGFIDVYHASAAYRLFPFDFIATYEGQRVLIDVTTGMAKMAGDKQRLSISKALMMPVYILFIKPDFSKYQLSPATAQSASRCISQS